jgi:hypothetical protein
MLHPPRCRTLFGLPRFGKHGLCCLPLEGTSGSELLNTNESQRHHGLRRRHLKFSKPTISNSHILIRSWPKWLETEISSDTQTSHFWRPASSSFGIIWTLDKPERSDDSGRTIEILSPTTPSGASSSSVSRASCLLCSPFRSALPRLLQHSGRLQLLLLQHPPRRNPRLNVNIRNARLDGLMRWVCVLYLRLKAWNSTNGG